MGKIISATGEIHGRGSMPRRWVSKLTKEEREAVKNKTAIVLVKDTCTHHNCSEYKEVYYFEGKYMHRNYKGEV